MAQGVAAPQRSECAGRKLVHSADLLADCFPSLLLSISGTEFFGLTQQVCSVADHVIVSGSSLLSDASHDTSVAVPVDLTSSVCEGSQQNDCNHRQSFESPMGVQYRSSYAQG
jgi:hypothetical protein